MPYYHPQCLRLRFFNHCLILREHPERTCLKYTDKPCSIITKWPLSTHNSECHIFQSETSSCSERKLSVFPRTTTFKIMACIQQTLLQAMHTSCNLTLECGIISQHFQANAHAPDPWLTCRMKPARHPLFSSSLVPWFSGKICEPRLGKSYSMVWPHQWSGCYIAV